MTLILSLPLSSPENPHSSPPLFNDADISMPSIVAPPSGDAKLLSGGFGTSSLPWDSVFPRTGGGGHILRPLPTPLGFPRHPH
ncbi:hypothetical protein GDO78_017721 [Eleutherodactylus coqui]|uniref:Uncharacterized protein n=1 Tax=Eleutherodactylus coqui TaxID=57060 RepID=A0A8J6B4C2_ELECQ|nr:hypothetical protein GDO78_017721 [Eleutherodactylus coqui]